MGHAAKLGEQRAPAHLTEWVGVGQTCGMLHGGEYRCAEFAQDMLPVGLAKGDESLRSRYEVGECAVQEGGQRRTQPNAVAGKKRRSRNRIGELIVLYGINQCREYPWSGRREGNSTECGPLCCRFEMALIPGL